MKFKQSYFSNIYWHFTGSQVNLDWSKIKMPRDILSDGKKIKNDKVAVKHLFEILDTKSLKATAVERIENIYETEKFCCVTDIPLKDLLLHKKYYGNVAIGFKPNSIHNQFNPVLYLNESFLYKKKINIGYDYKENIGGKSSFRLFAEESRQLNQEKLNKHFLNHVKFTVFSDKEDESFYQEREWRKNGDFNFEFSDIVALIFPKNEMKTAYKKLNKYSLAEVSILSWEIIENS
jgi:hypothetical protein